MNLICAKLSGLFKTLFLTRKIRPTLKAEAFFYFVAGLIVPLFGRLIFDVRTHIKHGNKVKNKIGAVSRILGLSTKTIRYYESVGLVDEPQRTGVSWHSKGQRIYEEKEIDRLRFIKEARQLNFSISEIKQVLEHYEKGPACGCSARPHLKTLIKQKLSEIDSDIQKLEATKSELHELLNRTLLLENKTPEQLLTEDKPKIGDALLGRISEKKT